jgi:hypothetical protein
VAVLKVNFKGHSHYAKKIEKGEFAIEDAATRRDIDLNTNWELCFSPGQRVEMSIVVAGCRAYRNSSVVDPDSNAGLVRVSVRATAVGETSFKTPFLSELPKSRLEPRYT